MLPESEKMNGSSVKTEPSTEIKEEIKEENPSEQNLTKNHSGPPSNKLTNGETENNNQKGEMSANVKQESSGQGPVTDNSSSKLPNENVPTTQSMQQPLSSSQQPIVSSPQGASVSSTSKTVMSNTTSMAHSMSSDSHFLQQQSQIFVFSTRMANDAAELVMAGKYKNILNFHTDQPETQNFLQKNNIKITPIQNRPQMPQSMMGVRPGMVKTFRPGVPGYQPNPSRVAEWVQEQESHLQDQNFNMGGGMNPRMPNNSMRMMHPWPSGGPPQGFPGNYPMFPEGFEQEMMFHSQNTNLSHHKVPDENLTPEQLKKREESLTNLRKIQQMLFPEQRGGGHPGFVHMPGQGPGPGGMMPNEMMMQQNMMSPEGMIGNQPGMMGPDGMMSVSQGCPMPGGPPNMMMSHMRGPGPQGMGPGPQNMQNLSPPQREWLRLQQEYYMDKRRHQQQQIAQRMGHPNMEMSGGQQWQPPPPSYSSTISQKRHGSVGSLSTSPNNNGPIGSPIPGFDPNDPLGGVFPPRQQKSPFTGMNHPEFGGMNMAGPTGGPGNFEQSFGPHGVPMHPGMVPMMSRKNSQVTIQRAGNPEQFIPEISTSPIPGSNKPPPSYAQSQKRKRVDLEEELYKNLQPTPSPQQINYNLNQFEGQELTITKQLNAAYREPIPPNDQSQNHSSQNQVPHSPMHGPGSNRGPMSNSSQTSSGPLSSPGPMPGQNPTFGASMRLSHFDPSPNSNMSSNNGPHMPSNAGPHLTPSTKSSSMSNITSASLANLAKGVEHLSNQMQQNMMQGGPFHSIQMQGQQGGANPNSQNSASVTSSVETSSQNPSAPSVNNTFVNATMSIQQLNIQSVNNPHGHGYNPTMSVQQMNMEQQQHSQMTAMSNSGVHVPQGMPSSQSQGMPCSMPQGMPMSSTGPTSSSGAMSQQTPIAMGHPGMRNNPQQMGHGPAHTSSSAPPNMMPQGGRMSPNFSASSMGNANVQIQAKAPNTIQYLPAHPPTNQPGPQVSTKRPDIEFMQRFASPMGNIENKVPTSKMQYFPQANQPQSGMENFGPGMQPSGRCSPFAGPGVPMNSGIGPHPMQRGGNMPQEMHPNMPGNSGMNMMNTEMHNQEAMMMSNQMASMQGGMPPGGMMSEQMMARTYGQMSAQGAMMSSSNGNMMRMEGMATMAHQNSPPFPGGRENMMEMMHGGPMPGRNFGPGMERMSGQGHGPPMNPMGNYGPMSRQGGMRMSGPGNPNMPNMLPNGPGHNPGYNAQYEQFQQQLYSQGRSRQMSPMGGAMMPGPGQPQYMNMMPNMP